MLLEVVSEHEHEHDHQHQQFNAPYRDGYYGAGAPVAVRPQLVLDRVELQQ